MGLREPRSHVSGDHSCLLKFQSIWRPPLVSGGPRKAVRMASPASALGDGGWMGVLSHCQLCQSPPQVTDPLPAPGLCFDPTQVMWRHPLSLPRKCVYRPFGSLS